VLSRGSQLNVERGVGVDVRIILKWMLKKWDEVFTVLHWSSTGPSGGQFPVEAPVGAVVCSPKIYNRSWWDHGRISGR
jgi:hypothetical protein